MTVQVYEYMGEVRYRGLNLPAPKDDPDDQSPLYRAMLKRLEELGLTDGGPVRLAALLRYAEDQVLDFLDMEGYPEPDDESWEDDDERYDEQCGYL